MRPLARRGLWLALGALALWLLSRAPREAEPGPSPLEPRLPPALRDLPEAGLPASRPGAARGAPASAPGAPGARGAALPADALAAAAPAQPAPAVPDPEAPPGEPAPAEVGPAPGPAPTVAGAPPAPLEPPRPEPAEPARAQPCAPRAAAAPGREQARAARDAAAADDDEPTLENTLDTAGEPAAPVPRRRSVAAETSRAFAFPALAGALGAYFAAAATLPAVPLWWEVAIVALGLIPATFALVGLALPARRSRLLLPAVVVLAGLAALLEVLELATAANFVKLAAVAGAGWFFLRFFESVSWVVLIALLIIPVDAYSVAQGPTKQILEERPEVFDRLSVAFPVPGSETAAQLGLPDVLFFALFVGAAERFGLRLAATWLACTLSFGATLALTVGFEVSGLPALPLLSVAFVLVNADLLWRQVIRRRRP